MNKYEQISSCPETLREKKQTKKQKQNDKNFGDFPTIYM